MMNGKLKDLFKIQKQTSSTVNIGAGATIQITMALPSINGYTPLSVHYLAASVSNVTIAEFGVSGNNINAYVYNGTSSSKSYRMTVAAVYAIDQYITDLRIL